MIAFNNLARLVALNVVLAGILGSAAPTPSPERAIDNAFIPLLFSGSQAASNAPANAPVEIFDIAKALELISKATLITREYFQG